MKPSGPSWKPPVNPVSPSRALARSDALFYALFTPNAPGGPKVPVRPDGSRTRGPPYGRADRGRAARAPYARAGPWPSSRAAVGRSAGRAAGRKCRWARLQWVE
ncbi:hypothetical protein GCM10010140_00160 [Streptosporangium pseudovulgare]|uniref:Uncharacterized protein n=1 Tax=Streptosporangium pseudovulgare TaxID=35765 RepID=A0ABQ2QCY6_9ACTN|nr:hypothetical protein GCM10010140_00160 [Streptosporangium pseudovulgare]